MQFDTTHWSLVLAAGGDDSRAAREALGALCETYWYPLYAYVRRRGRDPEDASDLTQAFLASLMARDSLDGLGPERGRFRAFLLASMKHFLANDAASAAALKRGGGIPHVPLVVEADSAEVRYRREPVEIETPETLFERRWALTLIDQVLDELRVGWTEDGRAREFDALKGCLLGEAPDGGYAAVATALEMTPGAVKTAVHRLRRRFHRGLRSRIAQTVADPADIEDEIRHLIRAVGF